MNDEEEGVKGKEEENIPPAKLMPGHPLCSIAPAYRTQTSKTGYKTRRENDTWDEENKTVTFLVRGRNSRSTAV